MQTASDALYVFSHYFCCDNDTIIEPTIGHRTSSALMYDEKGVLLLNIGRIHCLHPLAEYCGCNCTHCTHGAYAYVSSVKLRDLHH